MLQRESNIKSKIYPLDIKTFHDYLKQNFKTKIFYLTKVEKNHFYYCFFEYLIIKKCSKFETFGNQSGTILYNFET